MSPLSYRRPTALEAAFLKLVSRGYPEITEQVNESLIAEYDPNGWCEVKILAGPPSPLRYLGEGPRCRKQNPDGIAIDVGTILSVNESGMLESVEILDYLSALGGDSPYCLFVDFQNDLIYPDENTPSA